MKKIHNASQHNSGGKNRCGVPHGTPPQNHTFCAPASSFGGAGWGKKNTCFFNVFLYFLFYATIKKTFFPQFNY